MKNITKHPKHYQNYGTYIEVSIANIRSNYKKIKNFISDTSSCSAVIKSNAYGVGIIHMFNALITEGCKDFWVNNLEELIQIKNIVCNKAKTNNDIINGEIDTNHKIYQDINIYVLHGPQSIDDAEMIYKYGGIPVLNSLEQITLYNNVCNNVLNLRNQAFSKKRKIPAVLHIDTGMRRLGLEYNAVNNLLNEKSSIISNIDFQIIMSHLVFADEKDNEKNTYQLSQFSQYKKHFKDSKFTIAASYGMLLGTQYHLDIVRPGIAIYGSSLKISQNVLQDINKATYSDNEITCSDNNSDVSSIIFNELETKPIFILYVKIIQRNVVKCGDSIGYSATYRTQQQSKIWTVECGYNDGYMRSFSNLMQCYVSGFFLPVIGMIGMDICSVDATSVPDDLFYNATHVEFVNQYITIDLLASLSNSIPHEILSSLMRVKNKIYVY